MAEKPCILFVDDEPNVLAALKRMLRGKREEWNLLFVDTGREALELMKENKVDVIVSDIRMPGMSGGELLNHVREQYPQVIRIALSGQVDLNEVIRSIRAVHQYITKPCEADYLVDKIESAMLSRNVLADDNLMRLVAEIDSLPVVPKVFIEVEAELAKDEPDFGTVAHIMSQDVGLVAEVLKVVNSPYFGLASQVDSVQKAITLLGLQTLKTLILSSHLITLYDTDSVPGFSLTRLWDHCFRVSNIARLIADSDGVPHVVRGQCRIAGVLHDVGKLILSAHFPERYTRVLAGVARGGTSVWAMEKEIFGITHAEVGSYLMGLWGVPGPVVRAIGDHHGYSKADQSVSMYLSVANVIDHHCVIFNEEYNRSKLNVNLGVLVQDDERVQGWMKALSENWHEVEAFRPLGCDIMTQLVG